MEKCADNDVLDRTMARQLQQHVTTMAWRHNCDGDNDGMVTMVMRLGWKKRWLATINGKNDGMTAAATPP